MPPRIVTDTETVSVDALIPHPGNARRGNIDAIAESLTAHGQYRPIVANRRTGRIVAGNHTWRAAKRLGWRKIAVSWIDVDEVDETKIVLVDNRASDLATYDDALLSTLLRSLPDLEGVGYSQTDLDDLEGLWSDPLSLNVNDAPPVDLPDPEATIVVGPYVLAVDRDQFEAWAVPIHESPVKPEETIRRRLGFPGKPRPNRVDPESTPVRLSTVSSEVAELAALVPYPGNARQGDVGLIAESLRVHGQYRPIVVNRNTNEILVGNHTAQAARHLGWDTIAVTFVDVDEDEARRIVLVDNRTTDIATYDSDALVDLLRSVATDLNGTGFTGEDLDDLLAGADGRPTKTPNTDVKITVDKWSLKISRAIFNEWDQQIGSEHHVVIATRLDLPVGSWTPQDNA